MTKTHEPQTCRIWITIDLFLTVDAQGFVVGACFEGALGCVVPLSSRDGVCRFALKLPRAMADTTRENAFICQIVDTEARIVVLANVGASVNCGLLPAELGLRDVLRGTRQLDDGYVNEATAQHGCRIFVSFRKDRNPRFCSVKFEGEQQVVFPPAARADLSFLTREQWEAVGRAGHDELLGFRSPYYFELPPAELPGCQPLQGRLVTTIQTEQLQTVWYTALPSILYRWATATLQEAVSQHRHHDWRLEQHYTLIHRLLQGVQTLHSKGLIHGDLRPANIMACGSASLPEDYTVGDYGSFSAAKTNIGDVPEESLHTMVGPGVGRHRMSIFYAPERRAGVERESADVAVILRDGGDAESGEYFVHLGWRSRVIDPETNNLSESVLSVLREDWQRMRQRPESRPDGRPADQFYPGDRLRLREFIFTVLDAEEIDDPGAGGTSPKEAWKRVNFRCDRRFAKVLHERIAIYNNGEDIPDCTVVSIPNYVEIHQWSAATDLYGVGTLALYTIFTCGLHMLRSGAAPLSGKAPEAPEELDLETNPETMLAEMIETLESTQYFLYLWNDLEDFRRELEDPARQRLTSAELAQVVMSNPQQGTLIEFAKRTVNNLIRGVPHVRILLCGFLADVEPGRGVQYSAAHFLLFIHFVMASLHRRDHLKRAQSGKGDAVFCANRCERARAGGAADAALQRLQGLRDRFKRSDYDTFLIEEREFVDYDPRSDLQIRIELSLRNTELAECKKQLLALKQRFELHDRTLVQLRAAIHRAESQRDEHQEECDRRKQAHAALQQESEALRVRFQTTQHGLETHARNIKLQAKELRRVRGELADVETRVCAQTGKMLELLRAATERWFVRKRDLAPIDVALRDLQSAVKAGQQEREADTTARQERPLLH